MSKLRIVVARSLDNVIGRDGQLPWHEPEDMKFFKELTKGSTVIMGRNTWESLPNKLVNRCNIVVSSGNVEPSADGKRPDYVVKTLQGAIEVAKGNVFVIGGARLYEEALKTADTLYMTVIRKRVGTDNAVLFPDWKPSDWYLDYCEMSPGQTVIFKKYNRRIK